MHTIGAVFRTRAAALVALRVVAQLELPRSKLGMLTPGRDPATLGESAVAGVIPGIGPAIGLGEMGTLLAVTTRRPDERPDTRGHAHDPEEVATFHEAVRRGHSVVLVLVPDDADASRARDALLGIGESLEGARRRWEEEAQAYALAAAILRPSSPSHF